MQTPIQILRCLTALALVAVFLASSACAANPPAAAEPAADSATNVNTQISPAEYQSQLGVGADHILLDVRTPEEFASGHIPGAINIAVDQLPQRLSEVPQDRPVVVYCRSGSRSGQAAQILDRAGYAQIYDLGGIVTWAQQGFPVQ